MVRNLLLVAALGVGLAGCNTSYSYFEDEVDPNAPQRETTLAKSVLTAMGALPDDTQRPIDYTPRPPVAIPSTTELPAPATSVAAADAANFPVDTDEQERRRRAELAAFAELDKRDTADAWRRDPDQRVSASAVSAYRREGGGLQQDPRDQVPIAKEDFRLSPRQLRSAISGRERKGRVLTEEGAAKPREYLIQPPDEYRQPAETAALPEPKDIENSEWAQKRLYSNAPTGPSALSQRAPR